MLPKMAQQGRIAAVLRKVYANAHAYYTILCFFSEIISSMSDVKFSHDGQIILSWDYLWLKVWDNMPVLQPNPSSVSSTQPSASKSSPLPHTQTPPNTTELTTRPRLPHGSQLPSCPSIYPLTLSQTGSLTLRCSSHSRAALASACRPSHHRLYTSFSVSLRSY